MKLSRACYLFVFFLSSENPRCSLKIASECAYPLWSWNMLPGGRELSGPGLVTWAVVMEKILIVEDDRRVQKALSRLFESEGYRVQIASEGKAGLEAFRESPPALVVLDLMLPGMPGQ